MIKKICFYIFLLFCFFLNLIIDINIKKYIHVLNICFNEDIVLTNNLYIIICLIFAFITIFIVIDILLVLSNNKIENKGIKIRNDGTHGTADWMREGEISQVLCINDTPGIILGKFNENIVKLPFKSFFNKNICVFGSSR